ncbi:MAG: hypothetical protein ACI9KE_006159 [Polyangiales bacterium]|jgi:hypothetical protein
MATSALPPPSFDPLAAPSPQQDRPASSPWALWVALASVAGIVTFFLMKQPQESAVHSLAPVVVASTLTREEVPPEPVVEDVVESEVVEAPEIAVVVSPEALEEPETARMVSPMRATASRMVVRMTAEPAAAMIAVAAATPEPTPMPAMSTSDADLQETPSREEVQSALLAVRGSVRECMGRGGRVPVRVTVSGRTGRVTTAQVQDAYFARQPTGGCIAQAVRRARFPRFQQERLVVVYPYEF